MGPRLLDGLSPDCGDDPAVITITGHAVDASVHGKHNRHPGHPRRISLQEATEDLRSLWLRGAVTLVLRILRAQAKPGDGDHCVEDLLAAAEGQLVAQPPRQQQPQNLNPSLRCPACYLLTWLACIPHGILQVSSRAQHSAPENRDYSLAPLSTSRHAAPINAPQVPGTRRTLPWSSQMPEFARPARSDFDVSKGHSEQRRAWTVPWRPGSVVTRMRSAVTKLSGTRNADGPRS